MTAIALLAIILILGFSFRSVPGAVAPIVVAAVTVPITLGILALSGVALSQFALIAIPVLMGLGVLDSVHIVHAYYESHDLEKTLSKEIRPCFWTSLTTLIGFIVLVISPISQVRSIGLVIAVGVPLSFIASFTFLPSLLVLTSRASRDITLRDPFKRWSDSLSRFIFERKRVIVSVGVVMTVLASVGIARLHVDLNFPKIFRSGTPEQESLQKFEEELSGAASMELILETGKQGGFRNPEVIKKVRSFSQALNLSANVAATISFLNMEEEMSRWLSDDYKKARIHVRMSTARPDLHERFESALDYMTRELNDWFSITPTGFGYLYKSMEKVMLKSFIETFAYALIGVMIALLLIARSLRFGLASMLANLMPIAIVLGLMGWIGVGISVGVVILPAVGLGLLADDTIHFLIALKREGGIDQESVTRAFSSTGWPLVMTQLILLAVFGSLVSSHFQSNVLLGIFMCFLLVVGLAFDILFVPAFALLWVFCYGRLRNVKKGHL
jgi:predicted RND superfamily exporter protein